MQKDSMSSNKTEKIGKLYYYTGSGSELDLSKWDKRNFLAQLYSIYQKKRIISSLNDENQIFIDQFRIPVTLCRNKTEKKYKLFHTWSRSLYAL